MHFTAYAVPNQPFHDKRSDMPDFSFETQAGASRGRIICGVDEAGRGPLAGPVIAAAVIINPENIPAGLNDSKVLSHSARERLLNILTKSTPTDLPCDAHAIVKGDAKSLSIAAASIVAKVTRDRIMAEADSRFPGYGWSGHKGYPTKTHRQAVEQLGRSPAHRWSFGKKT